VARHYATQQGYHDRHLHPEAQPILIEIEWDRLDHNLVAPDLQSIETPVRCPPSVRNIRSRIDNPQELTAQDTLEKVGALRYDGRVTPRMWTDVCQFEAYYIYQDDEQVDHCWGDTPQEALCEHFSSKGYRPRMAGGNVYIQGGPPPHTTYRVERAHPQTPQDHGIEAVDVYRTALHPDS
jgi:hypothetical protein